jgi:hypothetical protein
MLEPPTQPDDSTQPLQAERDPPVDAVRSEQQDGGRSAAVSAGAPQSSSSSSPAPLAPRRASAAARPVLAPIDNRPVRTPSPIPYPLRKPKRARVDSDVTAVHVGTAQVDVDTIAAALQRMVDAETNHHNELVRHFEQMRQFIAAVRDDRRQ